ncbi:MAG: PadR family transcriptional regulator [Terracidiphilus sp.]
MAPLEKAELLQGTLDLLILKVVALGPVHGYGISQRIRQISHDVLQVQQGSLYPALHRLEKRGWLLADWGESNNGREAKFYRLSARGRKQLAAEEQTWARLSNAVALILQTAE